MNETEEINTLAALLDRAEAFASACEKAYSAVRNYRKGDAIDAVDLAIDEWNLLINRAPKTLRAFKQDHLGIK